MKFRNNPYSYSHCRITPDFLEKMKSNEDIAFWSSDLNNINGVYDKIDKDYSLSEFKKHCMKQFVSLDEAEHLYKMKFSFDWKGCEYDGFSFGSDYYNYEFKENYKEPRFHYHVTRYEYIDDNIEFEAQYSLRTKKYIDNYFSSKNEYRYAPNCWTVIEMLINQDKLTILDEGNYIMFYYTNEKKFHLQRSSDKDVYFYKENFDEVINKIFKKFGI